jgi:hypothetical protein
VKRVILIVLLILAVPSVAAQTLTNGNFQSVRPSAARESAKKADESSAAKRKSYPFHGELESVASDGTSLALRGKAKTRIIKVTPQTRVFRGEAKSGLKAAVIGERVSGSVTRNEAGEEQALTVRLGGKQADDSKAAKKPAKVAPKNLPGSPKK